MNDIDSPSGADTVKQDIVKKITNFKNPGHFGHSGFSMRGVDG